MRHQVYGDAFDAPRLVEPLKAVVWGRDPRKSALANWVDGVRLFCTTYDPAVGRYRFDYSIFIGGIIGARWGSKLANPVHMRPVLAAVLVLATVKLVLT